MKKPDLQTEYYEVDEWWESEWGGTPFKYADEMDFTDEQMAEFADYIIEKRAVPDMIDALMEVHRYLGDKTTVGGDGVKDVNEFSHISQKVINALKKAGCTK